MKPDSRKKFVVAICRENRKNMTEAERIVWELVRNRRLDGKKFLRQHKIIYENSFDSFQFFVADFYCAEEKLILEIDGEIHESQKEYDNWRTSVLEDLRLRILRIKNEETIYIEQVKEKIRQMFIITHPPAPSLHEERG
ncbi:MAG: endonuclease domain-containing protein [Bacteroidales bacterium]|nr:endonuclease domain-containing protein [Bacteroidales bacterium]